MHYAKNLCHFVNTLYLVILPTIRPTDYMFQNYKHLGKEKWEIYANVVRKIYSEVGGLEEINMGLRDLKRYIKVMRTGFYDPNENMNYEKDKEKNENNLKDDVLEINTGKIGENTNKEIDSVEDKEKVDSIEIKEEKENKGEIISEVEEKLLNN